VGTIFKSKVYYKFYTKLQVNLSDSLESRVSFSWALFNVLRRDLSLQYSTVDNMLIEYLNKDE
jgi:hypothetical protein